MMITVRPSVRKSSDINSFPWSVITISRTPKRKNHCKTSFLARHTLTYWWEGTLQVNEYAYQWPLKCTRNRRMMAVIRSGRRKYGRTVIPVIWKALTPIHVIQPSSFGKPRCILAYLTVYVWSSVSYLDQNKVSKEVNSNNGACNWVKFGMNL